MNYTELFRDFLIANRAKKRFEEKYHSNNFCNAARRYSKLSFKDNFLTETLLKWQSNRDPFDFLKPRVFITWGDFGTEEYKYWDDLNNKWLQFVLTFNKRGQL